MTTRTIHIFETQFPYEDDDGPIWTEGFQCGPYTNTNRILLDAWASFYGRALDNGQTPYDFIWTWVDETTAEVVLKASDEPGSFDEVYTIKLGE